MTPISSLAWVEQSQCFAPYFQFLRASENKHDYGNLAMNWAIWRHLNLFLVFICLYSGRHPVPVAAPNLYMQMALILCLCLCLSFCLCLSLSFCIKLVSLSLSSTLFWDRHHHLICTIPWPAHWQSTCVRLSGFFGHLKTNAIFKRYINSDLTRYVFVRCRFSNLKPQTSKNNAILCIT